MIRKSGLSGANPAHDISLPVFYGKDKVKKHGEKMENVPRNVFRVCPDTPQTAAPAPVRKYNVIGASEVVLLVCENQITIDDLKKAAKCARFDFFRAYTVADILLSETDFPAKRNVYIRKAMKPVSGSRTRVFSICETTTVAPVPSTPAPRPSVRGFKIFRRSTGEVLRICENQITIDDLKKAAKCARYDGEFRAYTAQMGGTNNIMQESDFPAQKNVYITRARKDSAPRTGGTRVFSVCESTSTPPARQPSHVVAPAPERNTGKKKILRKAIEALKIATSALEELSGTF